jgi:lipooligosaccharide transport system permease protein
MSPAINLQLPRLRPAALAVWRRNLLVWRKLLGPALLMNFGEPTIYLIGLGFGLGNFIGQLADMPYLAFLASGIIASSAMTTATFEAMYSVYTRLEPQRTYQAILATPLEVDDILLGEMLWCGTKSLFSGLGILAVSSALGIVGGWLALWVLPVVFVIGLSFAGLGLIMSAMAKSYDFFNYYFVLVITPMFMLSGVFYPISSLPQALQGFVQVLPLTHAVELTRPLIAGRLPSDVLLHLAVLAGYAALGFAVAVRLVRRRLLV